MLLYIALVILIIYIINIHYISISINNKNSNLIYTKNNTFTNIGILILFCVLLFISAARDINIGTDTRMYYWFFYSGIYPEGLELGVIKIYELSRYMGDFGYWLFITSFFVLAFTFMGIKRNTNHYFFAVFFLVTTNVYFFTLNGVRQAMAATLVFAFLDLLINKSKKRVLLFILIITLAMLFHISALFLLILLVIPTKIIFNRLLVYIAFIATTIIYFSEGLKNELGNNLVMKYSFVYSEKYINNQEFFFEVNKEKGVLEFLPVLFQMLIIIYAIIFIERNNIKNDMLYLSANIYIFYLSLYGLSGIEAVDRFQNYLQFFNIYFLTLFSTLHWKYNKNSMFVILVIFVFFIVYYVLRITRNTSGILGV